MATLSEKYLAGFLDADGSIQVMWRPVDRADTDPTKRRGYLALEFSQRSDRDEVLKQAAGTFGGKVSLESRGPYSKLVIYGSPAMQVLNRIKQHLVIKRSYADAALSVLGEPVKVEVAQAYLKLQRRVRSDPLPNYPSRKWAAGYFDGDGSISARITKSNTAAIYFEVVASDFDSEGIELLQKAFGGTVNSMGKRAHLRKWTLSVPPSKLKEIGLHFGQYLIIKKSQFDFITSCAEMGHFRDGRSINAALKQLKTQPHRLSEPNAVERLLAGVRNVPDQEILDRKRAAMAHARSMRKR